jgi:hypothetical protein
VLTSDLESTTIPRTLSSAHGTYCTKNQINHHTQDNEHQPQKIFNVMCEIKQIKFLPEITCIIIPFIG